MGFRHSGWHISMCTLDRNDRRDVQKVVQMYVRELPEGGTKATQEGAAQVGRSTRPLFEMALEKCGGAFAGKDYSGITQHRRRSDSSSFGNPRTM